LIHHYTLYKGTDMSGIDQNETPQENCLNEENPQRNLVTGHHCPEQAASNVKRVVYADESWTFLRFAWEFLRLNESFKAACDKAKDTASKRRVAREYGLKHFVHYREEFDTSPARIRFNGADISSWSNTSTNKEKKIRPDRSLRPGEIAIYFDLNFMLEEPVKSLERQLDQARQTLSKKLASYAKKENKRLQERTLTNQKQNKPIIAYNVYVDFLVNKKSRITAYLFHSGISRDQFDTDPNLEKNSRSNASRAYSTAKSYITNRKYRELTLFVEKKSDTCKKSDQ